MSFFSDFISLFYPKTCIVCECQLLATEQIICTFCRHDLPIIPLGNFDENQIKSLFFGRIPIEKAASFLFYTPLGTTKKMIHALKYQGRQDIGVFLGNWFGNRLKLTNHFNTIEYVIPVPLHQEKLKSRGYNQLTQFGIQLSHQLQTKYLEKVIVKNTNTKTQTYKSRHERFAILDSVFYLTDDQIFKNKHIVLIDDVITTGATLEACCRVLLKIEGIKISIITMAFSDV